ncbi:hypothetical protein AAP_00554 [Ascosphaera apis ARSEF 7405]|uniref:Early meiotic induction protein 1 n=1 Tax=Ascosphaera apis ARSEF 7405 TaxID=392613 RepID=A0A168CR80_9EURO|nr:hypothetical protein AAP_00554 [Ascosphaera apis ARSEF 7405]
MGWWWKSSDKSSAGKTDSHPYPAVDDAAKLQDSRPDAQKSAATDDAELNELLSQWQGLDGSSSNQSQTPESPNTPHTPKDISEYNLYPREMSCRSAFDYAFFCQSFGGQFVNVYRYGGLRSCSDRWSEFWFCMRTNQLPDGERQAAIADYYRKKAIKYKTGPSSEDVWEMRTEPVKTFFQNDFETLASDLMPKDSTDGTLAA